MFLGVLSNHVVTGRLQPHEVEAACRAERWAYDGDQLLDVCRSTTMFINPAATDDIQWLARESCFATLSDQTCLRGNVRLISDFFKSQAHINNILALITQLWK